MNQWDNTDTTAEYIWLDSDGRIRSKVRRIRNEDWRERWQFDGSSCGYKETKDSEMPLIPLKKYDHKEKDQCLIYCAVSDDSYKDLIDLDFVSDNRPLFAVEQEWYYDTPGPFDDNEYCKPNNTASAWICEGHFKVCLLYGINVTGYNKEVGHDQWEYQIGPADPFTCAVDLIVSRLLLMKLYSNINIHPKPYIDAPGSGCHINFSTSNMRDVSGFSRRFAEYLRKSHDQFIEMYGEANKARLTGKNETCSWTVYKFGLADRSASVRISGDDRYIEDRRPGADMDPIAAFRMILDEYDKMVGE